LAEVLGEGVLVEVQEELVVAERGHGDAHLGQVVQVLQTEEGNQGRKVGDGREGIEEGNRGDKEEGNKERKDWREEIGELKWWIVRE
jgi:hypothetical protein